MKLPVSKRQWADVADWLAIALAASIPISTSATSLLAVLWLVAVIPTLTTGEFREEIVRPRSAMPLLLLALAVAGMIWAEGTFRQRLEGLDSFAKLFTIPFLIVQFQRSHRARWVLMAYLSACVLALVGSLLILVAPEIYWRGSETYPTLFKNPATQSGEFITCIAVLLFVAIDWWREKKIVPALAVSALCATFLCVIVFLATARTPLVILPFLLALLAFRKFEVRGALVFLFGAGVVFSTLLYASSYLQGRTGGIWTEIRSYTTTGELTSSGERLEFWKKSLAIIYRAPLIGHGTGSIKTEMAKETAGQTGPYATITPNPHQQTFAVAIQLGIAGALLLWAMWIVHWKTFRGESFAAWIGIVIVVQNIIGSLFNSHLFDFTQGWTYVVGFGVVAGLISRPKAQGDVS
jgi:hypothetical protein